MEKIIKYTQSGYEYWILNPKNKCASVDIVDGDIATIETLHDLLLDNHSYHLDFVTLKRARELTSKMYAKLYPKQTERRIK